MATPENSFSLGKHFRLFVGAEDATADADFILVENENEIEVSWSAEKEQVSTKSKGKVTLPEGDEEWTINVTVDAILVDNGFPLLVEMQSEERPVQVRDTKANKVILEGKFTANSMSVSGASNNARQTTFTLANTDVVTLSLASGGRAVTP